jgi:hypothetical protein
MEDRMGQSSSASLGALVRARRESAGLTLPAIIRICPLVVTTMARQPSQTVPEPALRHLAGSLPNADSARIGTAPSAPVGAWRRAAYR